MNKLGNEREPLVRAQWKVAVDESGRSHPELSWTLARPLRAQRAAQAGVAPSADGSRFVTAARRVA